MAKKQYGSRGPFCPSWLSSQKPKFGLVFVPRNDEACVLEVLFRDAASLN